MNNLEIHLPLLFLRFNLANYNLLVCLSNPQVYIESYNKIRFINYCSKDYGIIPLSIVNYYKAHFRSIYYTYILFYNSINIYHKFKPWLRKTSIDKNLMSSLLSESLNPTPYDLNLIESILTRK